MSQMTNVETRIFSFRLLLKSGKRTSGRIEAVTARQATEAVIDLYKAQNDPVDSGDVNLLKNQEQARKKDYIRMKL